MKLWDFMKNVYESIEERTANLEPIDIEYIPDENALKLEVGKWYRIKEVVCVYLDLKDSTRASFQKTKEGMAKIYEHIGTGITKIFQNENFKADFIDIKGDGGFALYKGNYAEIKAFLAAETFKTYSYKHLKKKFTNIEVKFGIGITKGNVLVKKVGVRNWNYPVWSGKPVNYSAYICKDLKKGFNFDKDLLGVDENIYRELYNHKFKDYLIMSCGCPTGKKSKLWREKSPSDSHYPKFYYLEANWCDKHGEEYINAVIELIKQNN